jgi:platelet-activating factor acetylhydrolase isoform II
MRTFELLLWIVSAGWVGFRLVAGRPRRADVSFGVVALAAAMLHLGAEGARFHLAPTYAIVAALMCLSVWQSRSDGDGPSPRWRRVLLGIPAAAFIAVAGVLPALFPVFSYEQPSGPFGIGTAEYTAPGAAKRRELVIQIWYPIAGGTKGTPVGVTSQPKLLASAYASFTGLPAPLFDNLRLVKTHAIAGMPVALDRQRYPVVLFSHGPLSANRSQSVFLMEALASHGFMTVAIDHTGYASTTIFPDGHAVLPSADASWPAVVDAKSSAMLRKNRHRSTGEAGAQGLLSI